LLKMCVKEYVLNADLHPSQNMQWNGITQ
jgi:hypothetical protein